MRGELSDATVYIMNAEMREGVNLLVSVLKSDISDNAAFTKLYSMVKRQTNWIRDKLVLDGHEDFDQFAMIALMRAVDTFDKNRGSFKQYYFMTLKGKIFTFAASLEHKVNKFNYNFSKDIPEREWDGGLDFFESREIAEKMKDDIPTVMTNMERNILELRQQGMTYRQITKITGTSNKQIDNALCRIKKKVKKCYGGPPKTKRIIDIQYMLEHYNLTPYEKVIVELKHDGAPDEYIAGMLDKNTGNISGAYWYAMKKITTMARLWTT